MIVTRNDALCPRDWTYCLRAFSYNPTIGEFTTLDPYAGDPTNPLSYNKYLYTQGDPINGEDPTGTKVYEVGRSIRGFGTHTFVVIIPDDQDYFKPGKPGYMLYHLLCAVSDKRTAMGIHKGESNDYELLNIDGQAGFTIAADAFDKLRLVVNQFEDLAAAQHALDPSYKVSWYSIHGAPEPHLIAAPPGMSDSQFIVTLMKLATYFGRNELMYPIDYPTLAGMWGGYNSNSFARTLLRLAGATPWPNFAGWDPIGNGDIPGRYFNSPENNRATMQDLFPSAIQDEFFSGLE